MPIMSRNLLEAGKIVNTHGVRGEVKIQPWADSPEFLIGFDEIFIDGNFDNPVRVLSAKVHKSCVIAALEGFSNFDEAVKLKNRIIYIDKDDVSLDDGQHFVADLIGLCAICADTNEEFGTVIDVLSLPSNNVYVIKGEREIMVPAVPEFVIGIDLDAGTVRIRLIEGM